MLRTVSKGTMAIMALCVGLFGAVPLEAAGGGGGSTPGSSGPRYDPSEEYRKGMAALQERRFAEAKKHIDRVLTAAPTDASANYLAGMARVGLNDPKGSLRYFQRAIKSDRNMIAAEKAYGTALVAAGEKDKAAAELEKLKARAAECAGSCPQAAELKTAIDTLAASLAGGPHAMIEWTPGLLLAARDGDTAYLDAVALINEHRYDDAIASLRKAEQAFGPHPDILTYLGFAHRKLKRYDVAEAYYRQALAVAPAHRGALEYYGELMIERGDMAGARAKLATLDRICAFGCYEAEELRRWIDSGRGSSSS